MYFWLYLSGRHYRNRYNKFLRLYRQWRFGQGIGTVAGMVENWMARGDIKNELQNWPFKADFDVFAQLR